MPDSGLVVDQVLARFHDGPDTARRLFHGRGHCYPGFEHLSIDRFADCLHVGVYSADTAAARALAAGLWSLLPLQGVTLQHRAGRSTRVEVVHGTIPDLLTVTENGLRFGVRVTRNQNTGLFLDMAPGRSWVHEHASGASVLNLFAYTCAFSVAAIAGGASRVVNNDMSRNALAWGGDNHVRNGHDLRLVHMLPHNVFRSWWKFRQLGPYDMVIVDPPTNQRGSFVAERQYGQVLKRLPGLCAPGSRVVACLNSPFVPLRFLTEQMQRWCPACRFVDRLPPSPDFPDVSADRSLKVALFRYEP